MQSSLPTRGESSVAITPLLDYLKPSVDRPDLFEERYNRETIHASTENHTPILESILLIITSAFIFVTIVGWFGVLQVWYDTIIVDPSTEPLISSRFYYAVTATFITILEVIFVLYLYAALPR